MSATHYNTLHPSATHSCMLQHTASHCNTLHHTATHCNALCFTHLYTKSKRGDCSIGSRSHTATHCNTLQHTATHCNTPQHTATHCNTPQHSTTLPEYQTQTGQQQDQESWSQPIRDHLSIDSQFCGPAVRQKFRRLRFTVRDR